MKDASTLTSKEPATRKAGGQDDTVLTEAHVSSLNNPAPVYSVVVTMVDMAVITSHVPGEVLSDLYQSF